MLVPHLSLCHIPMKDNGKSIVVQVVIADENSISCFPRELLFEVENSDCNF
jgi:hypothetical protein